MRDIIQATICFALLLCVCAYGQARTVAGGGVAAAAGCAGISAIECKETVNGNDTVGQWFSAFGTQFVADDSDTKCRLDVAIWREGTPTYSIYLEIWTDDGGSPSVPDSMISGQSYEIQPSDVTPTDTSGAQSSPTQVSIDWTPSNGTSYWVVLTTKSNDENANDFYGWVRRNGCTTENIASASTAEPYTWGQESEYYSLDFAFKE